MRSQSSNKRGIRVFSLLPLPIGLTDAKQGFQQFPTPINFNGSSGHEEVKQRKQALKSEGKSAFGFCGSHRELSDDLDLFVNERMIKSTQINLEQEERISPEKQMQENDEKRKKILKLKLELEHLNQKQRKMRVGKIKGQYRKMSEMEHEKLSKGFRKHHETIQQQVQNLQQRIRSLQETIPNLLNICPKVVDQRKTYNNSKQFTNFP